MVSVPKLRFLSTIFAALSLTWFTGCVGPRACGPGGDCGPIGISSCDGCGECEGCGELYVDPWVNHPPSGDPCDSCGNYNGQSCGSCRSVFSGVASMWGYRCGDCGCGDTGCGGCDASCGCETGTCDSGCDSCGGCEASCGCDSGGGCDASCGGCDSCGGVSGGMSGDVIYEPSMPPPMSGQPTPANVIDVLPAETSYQPQRTRKIFRTRPALAEGPPRAADY